MLKKTIDRGKALEIICRHFTSSGIQLDLDEESLYDEPQNGFVQFRWLPQSPFDKLLEVKGFTDRRGSNELFFHFREIQIATSIIKDCSVHLNNLSWQKDKQELIEFYERSSLWNKDTGFAHRPLDSDGAPIDVFPLEEIKKYIHVMCLSRVITERHWTEYAKGKGGVCFIFQIIDTSDDEAERKFYELRDVYYDQGNTFEFIRNLQADLVTEVGYPLNLSRVPILATTTKREPEFGWEVETRLVIDQQYIIASFGVDPDHEFGCVEVESSTGRHYLRRRLKPTPFSKEKNFKIRVRGILWGSEMDPIIKKNLEEIATVNFPGVKLFNSESEAVEFSKHFKFDGDDEEDPTEAWFKEMRGNEQGLEQQ